VVPDRALRDPELARQLLGRPCAFAQQPDDSAAQVAAERAELLGIVDDEDVRGGVVDKERTVDDCGTYGISRPLASGIRLVL
jgi:hypothetical protein